MLYAVAAIYALIVSLLEQFCEIWRLLISTVSPWRNAEVGEMALDLLSHGLPAEAFLHSTLGNLAKGSPQGLVFCCQPQ